MLAFDQSLFRAFDQCCCVIIGDNVYSVAYAEDTSVVLPQQNENL
jgi:hypothetical protein